MTPRTTSSTTAESLRATVDARKAFLRITDTDGARLRSVAPQLTSRVREVVDQLYAHLQTQPALSRHLADPARVRNLKEAQVRYYDRMMEGRVDEEYLRDRVRIGNAHERVGLDPEFYLGAYAWVFTELLPPLFEEFGDRPQTLMGLLQSLIRILFFDMTAAIDTYIVRREETAQQIVNDFTKSLEGYQQSLERTASSMAGTTSVQADGLQRQSTAVTEITTAMSELSQTSRQALSQAESVVKTTEHTIGVAREGKEAVTGLQSGMNDIKDQMHALEDRIARLSEQTQQIGEIIASVSEISEQSKLLALNAAIEAARAGEHGRGFAVVATEIRNLADQSKQSTRQVRGILTDIQAATTAAVEAVKRGTLAVDVGAERAEIASQRFVDLAGAVEESGDAARLIGTVSRQQGEGISQIASAMEEISRNSTDAARTMKTIDDGTAELTSLASEIGHTIQRFRGQDATTAVAA